MTSLPTISELLTRDAVILLPLPGQLKEQTLCWIETQVFDLWIQNYFSKHNFDVLHVGSEIQMNVYYSLYTR